MHFIVKCNLLIRVEESVRNIKIEWRGPSSDYKQNMEDTAFLIVDYENIMNGNPTIKPVFYFWFQILYKQYQISKSYYWKSSPGQIFWVRIQCALGWYLNDFRYCRTFKVGLIHHMMKLFWMHKDWNVVWDIIWIDMAFAYLLQVFFVAIPTQDHRSAAACSQFFTTLMFPMPRVCYKIVLLSNPNVSYLDLKH